MITNPNTSFAKLKSFFQNDLSELDIPELIRMEDTNTGNTIWNALILNDTYSNLTKINFKNMEQSPYIITGENLESINLENLRQVEVGTVINNSLRSITSRVLQNTKIQKLNLPNFVGSSSPTSRINTDIGNSEVSNTSFWNNYWLSDVILGNSKMKQSDFPNHVFNGFWFRNNYFLKSLRLCYPYVIPIEGVGGLSSTPIGRGNGNGFIYVPDNLVTTYQRTTGWQAFDIKIKGLSEYIDPSLDTIEDSWETIAYNCREGNIDKYHLGDTKSIEINGINTQFILIGKNQDQLYDTSDNLYNKNSGKAALSWMERTISRFSPVNITNSFANGRPSYTEETVLHNYIKNNIYEKIPADVRQYIKPVIKYSRGFNENTRTNDMATKSMAENPNFLEYIWPFSSIEVGKDSPSGNAFRYQYFSVDSQWTPPILNYYLGDTLINTVNSQKISIALRDYDNSTQNVPNCLRPSDTSGESMIISSSSPSNPYLIVGFCT